MEATLLIELRTEELPPKSLKLLGATFGREIVAGLTRQQLARSGAIDARIFATPRRLGVAVPGVLAAAADRETEVTGPSVKVGLDAGGKPTPALAGFARKNNLAIDALEQHDTPKGKVFVARVTIRGSTLDAVLAGVVGDALKKLPIPKLMRWGDGDAEFVRPAHGLIMMHGNRVVPGSVLGLESGNRTRGHRFMGSRGEDIVVANADAYETQLRDEGMVIADFTARRAQIDALLKAEAARLDAALGSYGDLLDEVTALVEHPAVYAGAFDREFLAVPAECLILTMRQNQKYFPLFDAADKLTPRFLIVANMRVADPQHIVGGNQRVVRPRLEDARFFYNQDRRTRLESRVPQLAKVVYHNKLGSQLERVERIQLLAGKIARDTGANPQHAERAGWLAKADLVTGMVGEFPELQGTMGRYYAHHDGEPAAVADAVAEHYQPRYAGDRLPENPVACAVALADKMEALAGMFGIGQVPTGDRDPFALRRHALGVIRILVERDLTLRLDALIEAAYSVFDPGLKLAQAQADLETFIFDRMRGYFADSGYTTQEIEAVLSMRPLAVNKIPLQLAAVRAFAGLPEAASLAAANKRVANILRQAGAREEAVHNADVKLLKEPAERALFDALAKASGAATPLFKKGDFTGYLKTFAMLKVPVDAFFDSVMVMVDDAPLRQNRLALLAHLRSEMNRVADISRLAA